ELQAALGAQSRIQQLQAPSSCVARVGEKSPALLLLQLVQAREFLIGHVDFTADLKRVWGALALRPQSKRNVPDRTQIVRDVIPARTVTASCPKREATVLVQEGDRDAIDLLLDDVLGLLSLEPAANADVKLAQVGLVIGVVDGQHRHAVADGTKARDGLAA